MGPNLGRIMRGIRWRLLDETPWIIYVAPSLPTAPDPPPSFSPVRLTSRDLRALPAAEHVMRASGSTASVRERLDAGDELFGWAHADEIASFGWITYRPRILGVKRALAAPGRLFTYNFYTRERFRGRGLYQALIMHMRCVLGREGMRELLGDVQGRNTVSWRAAEKVGYVPVAYTTVQTYFNRFERERGRKLVNQEVLIAPIWP